MPTIETINDPLVYELRDVYHPDKQLLKALPEIKKAAKDEDLKGAVDSHLAETQKQVELLEKAFSLLGVAARAKKCEAMEGLVEEGQEIKEEEMDEQLRDLALIGAAQKVEHYEMAAYSTLCELAEASAHGDVQSIFEEILQEEVSADQKLSEITASIRQSVPVA
ncbi:MAG: DUF892 family protein [Bryobacterales bacterium]|nr:DUF892 family protein [Bryobacterales bacterium]